MKKLLLAASAAAAVLAAPAAHAASFSVTGGTPQLIPGSNDFKTNLNALLLFDELIGASVSMDGPAWIDFYFMGSESGNRSFFDYGPSVHAEENSQLTPWQNVFIGSVETTGGAFLGLFTSSNAPPALQAGSGSGGFAVFVGSGVTSLSGVTEIYIGYDDIPDPLGDDNHDDMIIRAVIRAVPEPSTWALMIAGVAAVGVSMRRRTKGVRVAFS